MLKFTRTKNQIVLGAGRLYFARQAADGSLGGEIELGDTPGFGITIDSQGVEVWDSDEAEQQKLAEPTARVDRSASITTQNVSMENLAIFLRGDASELSQSSDTVLAEPIAGVQPGRWYQLGQDDDNPTGVRSVSAVVVSDGDVTTYDAVDADGVGDYVVDAARGRIYIMPGGAIAADDDIEVDYEVAATTRDHLLTSTTGPVRGALRYIADDTEGPNRDLYAPLTEIRANGEMALKSRQQNTQIQLQAVFLKGADRAALYLDGQAVAA